MDVKTQKYLASIPNVPDIKSVALGPDPNIVFAATGASAMVRVVDVSQRKVIHQVSVAGGPDATAYDASHNLVFAALNSKNLALIDAKTYKVVATLPLPGLPELMAVDEKAGRVFLSINDASEVVVIDTAAQQITTTYKGCDINAPTGIAYDADHGYLFVAGKAAVSIIDVVVDRCLGSVDIGTSADQVALNARLHHLYVANAGSRNLSVIDTVTFKPLGVVGTGPSAHGVVADQATGNVYVIVGRAGLIAIYHDP